MRVSAIIPNLDSALVGEVIAALRAQTAPVAEIIVVGRDRPGLVVQEAPVRLIDTGRPVPAAAARNRGAAAASGDVLLFVDSDCILAPEAVERLLGALRPALGAVVAGVVPEQGSYWRLAANMMAFPSFLTTDRAGARPCLPSFCLMVPRGVWEAVGAFDERFPGASCEDLDLTFRMRRAGYTLWCEPAAAVYHRPPRTSVGDVFRRHANFGPGWRHLLHAYPEFLPFSQALWVCEKLPALAPAALVPLALLHALRTVAGQPNMLRHWYAAPGMAWAQLGLYYGVLQAVRWAITINERPLTT